jgi:F420H(2)-dependent quinone reductase
MLSGHAPFALINRFANPVVSLLVRSPIHRVLGRGLVLVTVTGRRSGHRYTIPTEYRSRGEEMIVIPVGWPERKRWWRNLTGEGGEVTVLLRGRERNGRAIARGDERTGVRVEVRFAQRLLGPGPIPRAARRPFSARGRRRGWRGPSRARSPRP